MDALRDPLPLHDEEAAALFAELAGAPSLILAVSGGPDSTALLLLAAGWCRTLKNRPEPLAVTVDHGLRPEAGEEAASVAALAARLRVPHRTVRWSGPKPKSRLQERARAVRYALLAEEARRIGAGHIVTAHTLDDQAETVLFRLVRGSGIGGLGGMARVAPLSVGLGGRPDGQILVVRPLLAVPKARLIATLHAAGVAASDDPSNRDPRFARARLRQVAPLLADEGLDARRLAAFAERMRRAEAALDWMADQVAERAVRDDEARSSIDRAELLSWPEEVRLRVLRLALERWALEGPVELGKLELLGQAIGAALSTGGRLRRTLAGAVVTLGEKRISVSSAPPRRHAAPRRPA